jgi:hypothetical protein
MLSLQAILCLYNRNIKNDWDAEAVCRRIVYWGETIDLVTKRLRMFGGILSCHVNTLLHQIFVAFSQYEHVIRAWGTSLLCVYVGHAYFFFLLSLCICFVTLRSCLNLKPTTLVYTGWPTGTWHLLNW